MRRREYRLNILLNYREISRVIIDPHFEKKHSQSISDEIIVRLVKTLHGLNIRSERLSEIKWVFPVKLKSEEF